MKTTRKYFKAVIVGVAISLVLFLLGGCAIPLTHLKVKDELPLDAPKGYVEFYVYLDEWAIYPRIYLIQDGKEVNEVYGQIDWLGLFTGRWGMKRVRISKQPGDYQFVIKLGTASKALPIKIVENELVFIRVEAEGMSSRSIGIGVRIYEFSLRIIPGIHLKLTPNAHDALVYLSIAVNPKTDWGTRWQIADLLGTMEKIDKDRDIIESYLAKMSETDSDERVRKRAQETLEKIRKIRKSR
jgi:hypothetical protein